MDHKKLRQTFYNTKAWRELRKYKLTLNPLCEECLKENKITMSQDVHHIKSPFLYNLGKINYDLGYDLGNLLSLCKDCHGKLHKDEQNYSPPRNAIENPILSQFRKRK